MATRKESARNSPPLKTQSTGEARFNLGMNKKKSVLDDSPSTEEKRLPSLYRSANKASIKMQRQCFRFHWWHLALLFLGSAGATLAMAIPLVRSTPFYVVMTVILAVGFVINIVSRLCKWNEKWFDCRAVAESTKTATWRFMMKAFPFEDDSNAETTFISMIRDIRESKQHISSVLAVYRESEDQLISNSMRDMRLKTTRARNSIYLKSRLNAQKVWYTKKAHDDATWELRWFFATMSLQVFALISAISQFALSWSVNLVPIFMTTAAALIAWNQMKRHGELAHSYTVVAQELEEIQALSAGAPDEHDFSQLVNDVEYAISREHTMWRVRREFATAPSKS